MCHILCPYVQAKGTAGNEAAKTIFFGTWNEHKYPNYADITLYFK